MIAVDTNILVYAHRRDSQWHEAAARCIAELSGSVANWMIPWPCVHEFIAIVTHPRIYTPPSTLEQALKQVESWMESSRLILAAESSEYWAKFRATASQARVHGPNVHDARIAAICIDHGVESLFTADRDFARFPALKTRNPLVSQ